MMDQQLAEKLQKIDDRLTSIDVLLRGDGRDTAGYAARLSAVERWQATASKVLWGLFFGVISNVGVLITILIRGA